MKNVLSTKSLEIITISCNNDEGLAITAKNIIDQKNSNILWTIVDGSNSKLAKTLSLTSSISVRVLHDQGIGIYNAMNIGLFNAVGEFLVFLNAGDQLIRNISLREIIKKLNKVDVLFMGYKIREKTFKPNSFKNFVYKMPTSHQAIVFKRDIHINFPYDLNYKIAADFDVLHRLKKYGYTFNTDNTNFVSIETGGISDLQRSLVFYERLKIIKGFGLQKLLVIFSFFYCIPPILRKFTRSKFN